MPGVYQHAVAVAAHGRDQQVRIGERVAVALRAAGRCVLHRDQVAARVVLIGHELAVGSDDARDPALAVAQELDRLPIGRRDAAVADVELRPDGRDLADDIALRVELVLRVVRGDQRVARPAEERIAGVVRLPGRQVVVAVARLREHGVGRLQACR